MPDPTVCTVMLANGRPEMVARAVRAFKAQKFARKRLLIYDTTLSRILPDFGQYIDIVDEWATDDRPQLRSIGSLRNSANGHVGESIIVHWDSDDWSHPNRITEQVALLQSSGAECVGYREMLFWDTTRQFSDREGMAWLYSNRLPRNILGTSLCYWRKTWEAHPFPDTSQGEDTKWLMGLENVTGVRSLLGPSNDSEQWRHEPRMIACIHGGNTCARIDPAAREWRRVPEWDEYCRAIMEAKC